MGNFLGIPQATSPGLGERLPADRTLRWSADGPDPDLHIVLMVGADGNPAWRMFLPGNVREAPIPDLSGIPEITDIPSGFLTWGVFAVSIPGAKLLMIEGMGHLRGVLIETLPERLIIWPSADGRFHKRCFG